ncbi:MAG: DUF5777 family beta-barrel protein, partial [Bacteroidota bacterium]
MIKTILSIGIVGIAAVCPSVTFAKSSNIDSISAVEGAFSPQQSEKSLTQYIPPALSLERKSLRIINMQGAVGLPKGEWELFIQHRFGTFGSGAYNWYGLDQSYMRIGFDAGLSDRLTVGVSRSSMNKIADAYLKYQIKGKAKQSEDIAQRENKSEVTASWYSNVSVNTQLRGNISPEPCYFSNRLRCVHTWIISTNIHDRLMLPGSTSMLHENLVAV